MREEELRKLREPYTQDRAEDVDRRFHSAIGADVPHAGELVNEIFHLCGFFRAIGSTLDCLGATIIGVLGLPAAMRKSSIGSAQNALSKVKDLGTPGSKVQIDFKVFFESAKTDSGVTDWSVWTDQYRNMFVHRGRRFTSNHLLPRDVLLVDQTGRWIPRATSTLHLAKYPDKSDAEAMIHKDALLNEHADITFRGVFQSCRELEETVCERLLEIWKQRRSDPSLIDQPVSQWDANFKPCNFSGYEPETEELGSDVLIGHPVLAHRLTSSGTDDAHRHIWANSEWDK